MRCSLCKKRIIGADKSHIILSNSRRNWTPKKVPRQYKYHPICSLSVRNPAQFKIIVNFFLEASEPKS